MTFVPEVLADEDACYGAGDEAEEGADAGKEQPGERADDAAYGAADGAPVARPEAAGAVGGGKEVGQEGEDGEDAQDHEHGGADGPEVREDGVEQGRKEDECDAG